MAGASITFTKYVHSAQHETAKGAFNNNTIQDLSLSLGGAGGLHVRQHHHPNPVDFIRADHGSLRRFLWSERFANWIAVHVFHDRVHSTFHSRFVGH